MMDNMVNSTDYAWLLIEFIVKAAIALGIGFSLVLMVRKFGSAFCHRSWMWVFGASLAIPLLSLSPWEVLPAGEWQGSASVYRESIESSGLTTDEVVAIPSKGFPGISPPLESSISWPVVFLAIWLAGSVLLFLRSVLAHVYLFRLAKTSDSPSHLLQNKLNVLQAGLRMKRRVRLALSSRTSSPFSCGLLRPCIYLPPEAEGWNGRDIEMVLVHELEHVCRFDALAVMVSRMFLILNWVNPFAWLAVRHTIRLREEACDRQVLNSGYAASSYAALLVKQARTFSKPFYQSCATAVAESGTIEQRIKMILKSNQINQSDKRLGFTGRALPAFSVVIILVIGHIGYTKGEAGEKETVPVSSEHTPLKAEDAAVVKKLGEMIVPKIEFTETPFSDAINYLRDRSVELDSMTENKAEKGVNIVILGDGLKETKITLKLKNAPLSQVLRYSVTLAGAQMSIQRSAVVIEPGIASIPASVLSAEQKQAGIKLQKNKLRSIQIPKIEFKDTPLRDALAFLQQRSVELDAEKNPNLKGVNIVFQPGSSKTRLVSLNLTNLPLGDALYFTCAKAGFQYSVEASALLITQGR